MKDITKDPKFVYLTGYFAADGAFYQEKKTKRYRFEFTDGHSTKNGLEQSYQFMDYIKKIIESLLSIKVPKIRQRGNYYVLYFENKKLEKIFINQLSFLPGSKTYNIKIPQGYKNTNLEKYFWLGLMDGDGTIAKDGRKIAIEMSNKKIIKDFQSFLKKNDIYTELKEITPKNRKQGYNSNKSSFLIIIKSPFYGQYAKLIGFMHPRKKSYLLKHLNKSEFYNRNFINFKPFLLKSKIIDYTKILNRGNIFVESGKEILNKYSIKTERRTFQNVKFSVISDELKKRNFKKLEILREISNYRLKLSKGSTNSIKLPFYLNEDLLKIAKFVRLRTGDICLSKQFIRAYNTDPLRIIKLIETIFDIRVRYTSKKEPIFCSGVLKLFFSKVLSKGLKEQGLPKLYGDLDVKL